MNNNLSPEQLELVERFRDTNLAFERWNHRAHLVVAFWVLTHQPLEPAVDWLRENIQSYNRAHQVPTTESRGYHETMTRFWAALVHRFMVEAPTKSCSEMLEVLGDKELPLKYYRRSTLFSAQARAGWVPPDLQSL